MEYFFYVDVPKMEIRPSQTIFFFTASRCMALSIIFVSCLMFIYFLGKSDAAQLPEKD